MKAKVVFVTSDHANIFTLNADGFELHTMRKHGHRHSSEPDGHHQLKKNDDIEHFLHEVATELGKDASRVLLVGPAQAKQRLKSHIGREHAQLNKNIVGVETMDRATDPQVVAFARNFFTKLDVFEAL